MFGIGGCNNKCVKYIALISVNLIYACTSICTKMASLQEMFSRSYLLWIAGAIGVMGVYAVLWQQVIKRMPISTAFMFKGTSLIFILLISALLFGESITINNVIGSAIIITGIVLYAKS
jgi:drug/metabolite transporter (DMT)-like permease